MRRTGGLRTAGGVLSARLGRAGAVRSVRNHPRGSDRRAFRHAGASRLPRRRARARRRARIGRRHPHRRRYGAPLLPAGGAAAAARRARPGRTGERNGLALRARRRSRRDRQGETRVVYGQESAARRGCRRDVRHEPHRRRGKHPAGAGVPQLSAVRAHRRANRAGRRRFAEGARQGAGKAGRRALEKGPPLCRGGGICIRKRRNHGNFG